MSQQVWLTRQQLADRLQIPVKTLARWACEGDGPRYRRMGVHARYRIADVIAWENGDEQGEGEAA